LDRQRNHMLARQTTKPQELSQGTSQSPAIFQLLLIIWEALRQRQSIGQQTLALYIDDTHLIENGKGN
jgi:hypothetical protein